MSNSGPKHETCDATFGDIIGADFYLTCDLLAPHNGDHLDKGLGLYWRPDLVRYEKEQ